MASGSMRLFEPFQLKNVTLRNRFVLPAMQRGHTVNYAPSPAVIEFLHSCAKGGIALMFSEATMVDHPSATWQTYVSLMNRDTAPVWRHIVSKVHSAGSAMIIQLAHEGAIRVENSGGPAPEYPTLSPSGLVQRGRPNGQAASLEQLDELRDAYVRSALLAKEIGADGVEIHCAHGYFLDQFLWIETNIRTDRYGGKTVAERARFIIEITESIRKAVGPDFIITLRISQWKEVCYKARIVDTPEELGTLIRNLEAAGVDVFNISTRYIHHPEWPDRNSRLGLAGWVRSYTQKPIIAVGSVGLSLDVMDTFFSTESIESHAEQSIIALEHRLCENEFDLIGVGRSCIGDPAFVSKVQAGDFGGIRAFTRKDLTFMAEHWKADRIADAHDRQLLEEVIPIVGC